MKKLTGLYEIWGLTEEQFRYCEMIDEDCRYRAVTKDSNGNYESLLIKYTIAEYFRARFQMFIWNTFKGYHYQIKNVMLLYA